jgi:predicted metal-dependent enzyme (double-stranded beta helix superfamily)
MQSRTGEYALRNCAQTLIRLFDTYDGADDQLRQGILTAVRPLLERSDLTSMGAKRQGNFVNNSKYLYYDGQLEITLNQMPPNKQFPAHDHGTCEALIIYSGQLQHTVYERIDDCTRPGYAELKVIEDRVLRPGDISVMIPPVEIHSFRALTDDTFVLTVVEGKIKADRHFYQPEDNTYAVGTPRSAMPQAAA